MPNLTDRVDALERMLADIAEEVAYGTATHMRSAAQNKALAVLKELRPASAPPPPPSPQDLCMRQRVKDDDESEVCLNVRGHEDGHRYGKRPRA